MRSNLFGARLKYFAWVATAGVATLATAPPGAAAQIAAYGRVSPGERAITLAVPYHAGAPQIVATLLVKEGDRVTSKQKLAETTSQAVAAADVALAKAHLSTAEERLKALSAGVKDQDLAAQEAVIKSLEAEAKSAKAKKRPDLSAEKKEMEAHEASLDWKVTTAQKQLESMREVRPTDVAVARAEIAEAEAAVRRAEALLAETEILAPMEGQVLKVLTYPGEGTAGHGLLELGATPLTIKAELSVADANLVKVGAKASIKGPAWPKALEGTVIRIDPRVERSFLTAPSTFANVDRQIVEATIAPLPAEKLSARPGAEVTVLITVDAAAP